MQQRRVIAAAAMLVSLALASPAEAATASLRESVETAKALMLKGRSGEARALLQRVTNEHPRNNDAAFLLGLLAIEDRDYNAAVDQFRSILVRNPDAVRVRLELGRAFFLKRDYENAYRQFQFARAGRLPPGVGALIDRFVSAIRQQKDWSYNFSFALAPDSNINNGTSSRETELFGLPFELSDDTRRKSGIGVAIDAGAEFAPQVGDNVRLRLGAGVQRREYRDNDFDDMTVALHAGPRIVLPGWDLSLLATGFRRQFGGRRLSEGAGARIEATHYRGGRTSISLGASAQQVRYPDYPLQDGRVFSLWGGAVRALTPSSSVTARLGISRKTARTPELASRSGWLAAGYYRDLPGGFSVYVEPGVGATRYDAADPFFGERRKDRLLELRLAVLNRRIVFTRFTPRIALTFARRNSTIDLYDYNQRRLEVGLTSSF
jgi:opacity protein-like surface antigen